MYLDVFNIKGEKVGQIVVRDDVFNVPFNMATVQQAAVRQLANRRQGTTDSKTRGEISKSTRKLFAQKHTGRARAGSVKSPLRRGGGVVFGPKLRSYQVRLPRKMKQLSIRSVLSMKNSENLLKVVEDFSVESGKTKDFYSIATSLVDEDKGRRVLFIDTDRDAMNRRAGRNIPWLNYFDAALLSTRDLFYATQLVLTESAVKVLNEKYAGKSDIYKRVRG